MITFHDFSYAYPTSEAPVLHGVDLRIRPGRFHGLVGPSGSGKSTLAFAAAGFIPHAQGGEHTGSVTVDERIVADTPLPELVTRVGLVQQDPFNQISGARFSVREELAFGLENLGVEHAEMRHRVAEVLELLRIEHLADRSPYELSGGQQQVVAVGSMLVMRPEALILDEPTSQLDPAGSRMVVESLAAIRESGMTVLLIEHKLELLADHADELHVLVDGRIVAEGEPGRILTDARMAGWGLGATRFTTAAAEARRDGLWEQDRRLPVTLDAAAEGFRGVLEGKAGA
ncbi:energy-coupling factor transporter ATP-binding protein EcfA2 [Spinactinospora alkalitolerans]|uniref:Energy-coupling factor transporter ATP-binding protein EcfA2 n=1 Tax=Spinactinospora alkalitolerans TaxID=687207 RepID=A0A852TV90_9ACTN|nr:ABC transporter ATP-binding protein [Spinactinospora alkalitolerans]NYE47315.1 energy-coupling factor transporter ATP-binding protein EcfA2 [Spinactinospora alkalitolerans]